MVKTGHLGGIFDHLIKTMSFSLDALNDRVQHFNMEILERRTFTIGSNPALLAAVYPAPCLSASGRAKPRK